MEACGRMRSPHAEQPERDVPIGTTLWPITNGSLETVVKEDEEESKEFSLLLTIAADNREKLKGGNRYQLLLRVPVKVH